MRGARAALAALALLPGQARAASAQSSTATGVATATVITPITASSTADLDFGTLASAGAGAVLLSGNGVSSGAARYSGATSAVCPGACVAPHPAAFAVSGAAGASYTIAAPAGFSLAGIASDGSPAPALAVTNLTIVTASRPGAGAHGLIDGAGTDSFTIGATLVIPAALAPARYRASLPVTVTYE